MASDHGSGWLTTATTLDVLGMRRRTGKIQVFNEGDVYSLHVDAGKMILATSSNASLRLGLLLLRRGLVQPLMLQDVLRGASRAHPRPALGRTLLERGVVTRDALAASVEDQCVEIVVRVLEAEQGTFLFATDDPFPRSIEIVPLDLDQILARAARRQLDRLGQKVFARLLPRPHDRMSLAVELAPVSPMLTDPELLVALAVDRGNATLDGLTTTMPLDRLTVQRTVIGLLERGVLVLGASPRWTTR